MGGQDTAAPSLPAVPVAPSASRESFGGEAGARIGAHVPSLFACVRALAGDANAVDDIVHQTVVEALESWRSYDPSRDLGAWLRGIAVHLVRRHWREIRRGRAAVQALHQREEQRTASEPDPEANLSLCQQVERLLEALDRLRPTLREAFVLRVVERLPAQDVARTLRTSPAAVHTRVCEARAVLLAAIRAEQPHRRKGYDDG